MNNIDPFNIRRSSALSILQSGALVAAKSAGTYTHQALESGRGALETGKHTLKEARVFSDDSMSFSLPNNVPSFTNPQRRFEDGTWGSSGRVHQRNADTGNSVGDKIGGYFDKRELPMYKDKPYSYSAPRKQSIFQMKRFYGGLILLLIGLLYWTGFLSRSTTIPKEFEGSGKGVWSWLQKPEPVVVDWLERRERVKEAFILSWDGYERNAWGYDEYHPISKTGRQMVPQGMGWIIVDALDTLMLMNLTSRLSHAREWISTSLNYTQDHEVNTFETTIRMLGGLLSAHYLSTTFPDMAPLSEVVEGAPGEDLYVEKATDLADRLLGAYDSPTGVPYASVNLKTLQGITSHDDGGASSTAEAASLQLEMKYLAKLTGEKNYWDKAERVIQVIDDNGMRDGLLPIFIYPQTGTFRGDNIRLGSRGDSYYEYLIKQYLQTSKQEPIYLDMWDQALNGVRRHLITYSEHSQLTFLAERPDGLNKAISPKMDHLVCFMPGTIALGATGGLTEVEAKKSGAWGKKQEEEMDLARQLTKTCWGMYKVTATGLAPEIAHFNIDDPPKMEGDGARSPDVLSDAPDAKWRSDYIVKPQDSHNLQRPETVESLFYMWRITGDDIYRQWGWEMFKAFVNYTTVDDGGGFTSLDNANQLPPKQRDNMESFWLAETLKYFYLLFSPDDLLPLDQIVINTEAHIFPRFELGKLFSTGWKRKPRGSDGNVVNEPEQDEAGKGKVKTLETVQTKTFTG
ncbi:MAG: mannosyl-oligosaccharide alpha-1,2-mannosidase [Pycnora praestabilis]|nr:MAG: mannosyl-oligosaccharide alpha-1,2-mannosidase [Pycnora praestabilis]